VAVEKMQQEVLVFRGVLPRVLVAMVEEFRPEMVVPLDFGLASQVGAIREKAQPKKGY